MGSVARCIFNAPYEPRDRHSCESRNPGAAGAVHVAPGFRLALRASGMTGVDFKQRILVGPAWAVRDAWSFSPP